MPNIVSINSPIAEKSVSGNPISSKVRAGEESPLAHSRKLFWFLFLFFIFLRQGFFEGLVFFSLCKKKCFMCIFLPNPLNGKKNIHGIVYIYLNISVNKSKAVIVDKMYKNAHFV